MAANAKHASSANSSLPASFLNRGCFIGSLVCLHKSSLLARLAELNVNALDTVRFAGALNIN